MPVTNEELIETFPSLPKGLSWKIYQEGNWYYVVAGRKKWFRFVEVESATDHLRDFDPKALLKMAEEVVAAMKADEQARCTHVFKSNYTTWTPQDRADDWFAPDIVTKAGWCEKCDKPMAFIDGVQVTDQEQLDKLFEDRSASIAAHDWLNSASDEELGDVGIKRYTSD